jgi:hypothetical protein
MGPEPAPCERSFYSVAKDVLAARPWELMLNEDIFGVANGHSQDNGQ